MPLKRAMIVLSVELLLVIGAVYLISSKGAAYVVQTIAIFWFVVRTFFGA